SFKRKQFRLVFSKLKRKKVLLTYDDYSVSHSTIEHVHDQLDNRDQHAGTDIPTTNFLPTVTRDYTWKPSQAILFGGKGSVSAGLINRGERVRRYVSSSTAGSAIPANPNLS